ncbi:aldehyde dehydrogenase family protein [Hoeflea sp. YIM 152468]|uniref:aldehyde dehydrogenase family protein n=1 Tax=Hoeflea sp. YIM 152468 TaxID=3031759 RepID=UPI0023DB31A7|nr:aldehyde dehydrogenase family protein [Hoeflea sp. YIM 152468]MDF1607408.1 aldehyde dehydrogenase family protein [Hoeflea sp. YIM 152468]
MTQIPDIIAKLRVTHDARRTRPLAWRRGQLLRLRAMITENETDILEALHADLGRSGFETQLVETGTVLSEIRHVLAHLKSWMRPQRVATPLTNQPGRSAVMPEPLGVVLILAPWNYPFYLIGMPLIGAISAGNCAVLKPSEISAHTSKLLARLIPAYLDPDAIRVVEGGVETSTELLAQHFDHIFFTGSANVGKVVMTAAASHLTPVTLELGGKSPCIVHDDCDLEIAARRVAWGKFLNAGQTCVAPDYVLVQEKAAARFVEGLKATVTRFFGDDPQASPDYARIINDKHFDRVSKLIGDGQIACGGETDASTRYIAPTVLTGVDPAAPVMNQEIFGPVLPVISYGAIEEAIDFVNRRPKPLALYLFSNSQQIRDQVLGQTSSGGACINEVVTHLAVPGLPFGGVGASGMGACHGRASFDTFSHAKAVLTKSERFDVPLRYPPFSALKSRLIRLVS